MLNSDLLLRADSAMGVGVRSEIWPAWQRFKFLYLSSEGRVIDANTARQLTTAEAQAHALFFSLVSNDRFAFDVILSWTQNNLAAGSLEQSLPARRWGKTDENHWRVLDPDPTIAADLWLAYTLNEAGRLWNEGWYAELGLALARNILRTETATFAGLGATLLSVPPKLNAEPSRHFNAAHLPLSIIRGIARHTREPLWTDIGHSSERIIMASATHGLTSACVELTEQTLVATNDANRPSDDAIRVYLWAGLLPASDPARDKITAALQSTLLDVMKHTAANESLAAQTFGGDSPGFSAALLPMFANAHFSAALQTHRRHAADGSLQNNQNYYSDVLALFGLGWLEQRYRFNRVGLLSVRWTPAADRPH